MSVVAGDPNNDELQVSVGIVRDKQQTPARRYHVRSLYPTTFLPGGHFYLSFWELNRVAASVGTRSPTLENTSDRATRRFESIARAERTTEKSVYSPSSPILCWLPVLWSQKHTVLLRCYLVMQRGSVKAAKSHLMLIQKHWKTQTNTYGLYQVVSQIPIWFNPFETHLYFVEKQDIVSAVEYKVIM